MKRKLSEKDARKFLKKHVGPGPYEIKEKEAKRLGIHPGTIGRWVAKGDAVAHKVGGYTWVRKDEMERCMIIQVKKRNGNGKAGEGKEDST